MRTECIEAVTRAIGRKLNKQEVSGIEERIVGSMTQLARQDIDAWRAMSKAQQLDQAGQHAAQELVAEAARYKANVARQALATARNTARVQQLMGEGRSGASAAVRTFELLDRDISGVRNQYFGGVLPVLDYLSNASRFLGWKHDQPMLRDLVREIFGDSTKNTQAKGAAKSWLDTIEAMRTRFNAAGGDTGKLDYAYLPQPHDAVRVLKAGQDAWVDAILPKLDRARYVKPDGAYLTEPELRSFLESSWETISTGGLNKMEPGKSMGAGKLANRRSDARQIHFKDSGAYLDYMTEFGKGNPISAMQSHISALARDIALIEGMGPNPNQTARLLMDMARKADNGDRMVGPVTAEQTWNTLTGAYNHPVNVRLAEIAQGVRNVTTAVKLQGSFLSQFTDVGTLALNAKYNQIPVMQALGDMPKALGKEYKEYANRVSLISDSMVSDMNRWADGNGGQGWTSKLANATMRASFMEAWTDAGKRAFSVNMMGALGKVTRTDWAALSDFDRIRLERAGIDQATFDVWRAATPEQWRSSEMLTPDSIQTIPDAALDAAIGDRIGAIESAAQSKIEKLTALDDLVKERTQKRQEKFQSSVQRAQDQIASMTQTRERRLADLEQKLGDRAAAKGAQAVERAAAASDSVKGRIDLLQAKIEYAQVRADIDAYLKTASQQDGIRTLLEAVEDGASIGRGTVRERVHPDRMPDAVVTNMSKARGIGERADSYVQRYGGAVYRKGEQLGIKEGALRRRIQEMEQSIKKADGAAGKVEAQELAKAGAAVKAKGREQGREIQAKTKAMAKDLDARLADLNEYIAGSEQYQQRIADQLARVNPGRDAAIASARRAAKDQATTKLLGYIADEANTAITSPDLMARTIQAQGTQKGTYGGEIWRSLWLFKTFATSILSRQIGRIKDINAAAGQGAALAYGASLMTALTLLGGLSLQAKDMVTGKDPRPADTPRFWGAAFMQGGGMGIFGDILYTAIGGNSRGGQPNWTAFAGPVFGTGFDLLNVTTGNLGQLAQEKKTNFASEAIRFTRQNTPFANLWYAKGAIDHLIVNDMLEQANPGYLRRLRSRTQKEWGQDYWWKPDDTLPARAPDPGALLGE